MLTDYHIHIENGEYAIPWLEKFISTAKEKGITEIGITEHCYRFKETKHIYEHEWFNQWQIESIDRYFSLLEEAEKYFDINIKKGIEMDYLLGKEKEIENFLSSYSFDYIIGSVHWINDWGFDIPEMSHIWNNSNLLNIYTEYFSLVNNMAQSKLFDIVGHFDVIKVFGYEPDTFDDRILKYIYRVTREIQNSKMCIEINTAGLRKPVREIYPKQSWLQLFHQANIPIVLSSDAHYPKDVGADYDKALKLAYETGYKFIAVFKSRNYELQPLG